MHRLAPPRWRAWTNSDAEPERVKHCVDDIRTVLVPHCHGYVCLLDPATATAYVSAEFDALTRARSLCRAIEEFRQRPRRPHLEIVPHIAEDDAPTEQFLAVSG